MPVTKSKMAAGSRLTALIANRKISRLIIYYFYSMDMDYINQLPDNLYKRGFLVVDPGTPKCQFSINRLYAIEDFFRFKLIATEKINMSISSAELTRAINILNRTGTIYLEGEILAYLYLNGYRVLVKSSISPSGFVNVTTASASKVIFAAEDFRLDHPVVPARIDTPIELAI